MNANRKKTGRTLKKAVMASVIAGTLATSVAYPGLMGVPGAQVAMAEEWSNESGKFTYEVVGDDVKITDFTGEALVIPEKIDEKAVASVEIHDNASITSFDATACKTGLTKVDLTRASKLTSVNCSGCGELVDVVVEENPELTDLNVNGTKAEKVCIYGSSKLVQDKIQKPEKTKIQRYSVDRKDDSGKYIYRVYSDETVGITGLYNSTETDIKIPKTITGNGETYIVTGIDLDNAGLTKLELSACCENLTYLSCAENDITELDVSNCTNLEYLYCYKNNGISVLNVSNCTKLKYLYCYENNISVLDVSSCRELDSLYCSGNNISELNVSNCTKLDYLNCEKNNITGLDVRNCTELKYLFCSESKSENKISELNVSNCTKLERLACDGNNISELDVRNCTELVHLVCSENGISKLDVSNCTKLELLFCYENNITELDVKNCTKLKTLYCENNNLEKLTVSGISTLTTLDCSYNENLSFLNVQNDASLATLNVSGDTSLKKIYAYNSLNLTEDKITGKTAEMQIIREEYTGSFEPDPGTEPTPGTDPTPTTPPSQGGSDSGTTTGGGGNNSSSSSGSSSSSSGGGSSVAPVATPTPTPAPEQKPAAEQTPAPGQTPSTNPAPATEPAQGSEEKADKKEKNEPVTQKEKGITTEAKISGKTTTVTLASNKKKVEVPKTVTDEDGKKHKVTKLGAKAFAECSKAEQIVLPASIVSVDKKAFSGIKTEEKTIILDASLTKKEVRKIEKKLRKAGFKGIIKQAEKKDAGKNQQTEKK